MHHQRLLLTRLNWIDRVAAFLPLAKLPRIPASDLKKLGWRGMMNAVRSKGRFLVTNHGEAEAVIQSTICGGAKLGGKVKAGSGY